MIMLTFQILDGHYSSDCIYTKASIFTLQLDRQCKGGERKE